jgi:hypothetical protein
VNCKNENCRNVRSDKERGEKERGARGRKKNSEIKLSDTQGEKFVFALLFFHEVKGDCWSRRRARRNA